MKIIKSTVQWKELFAQFHCTIMKMEISILYHVIVNSQLNRDNLTRCYIIRNIWQTNEVIETKYFYGNTNWMVRIVRICMIQHYFSDSKSAYWHKIYCLPFTYSCIHWEFKLKAQHSCAWFLKNWNFLAHNFKPYPFFQY